MDFLELDQLAGLLRHDEGMRLAEFAAEVPSWCCIVELGAYKGKSACYLARGSMVGAEVPVFSVDLWHSVLEPEREDRFRCAGVLDDYLRQTREAGLWHLTNPINQGTTVAATGWTRPVGLLFVDADHSFEGAVADYEAWARLVPSGGVIAFHDYNRNVPGVIRAVDEHVVPTGLWDVLPRVRHLWTARRR